MSLDDGLRLFLLEHPGVAAEVVDRVSPDPLPQGERLPAITYLDVVELGSYSNDGPNCLVKARYQLSHWAQTKEAATRVERATRGILDGYQGSWPGGWRIMGVFGRATRSIYEPETKLWRMVSDYQIRAIGA